MSAPRHPVSTRFSEVVALYNAGWSINRLAAHFRCGAKTITELMDRHGFRRRQCGPLLGSRRGRPVPPPISKASLAPDLYCSWCDGLLEEAIRGISIDLNEHRFYCRNPRCKFPPNAVRRVRRSAGATDMRRMVTQPDPDPACRLVVVLPVVMNDSRGLAGDT